jgi:hypothetical protein
LNKQLNRFLAVISDLYTSFLDKDKRANIGLEELETLPPLAVFQHDGQNGPFTMPIDLIQRLVPTNAGVVSMPATYADAPIIWGALAHETGGHDVTHATAGLLEELSAGVGSAFAGMSGNPAFAKADLTNLWAYWMDEASADVYGLLNMGPNFALNLAVFFVALNEVGSGSAVLRMQSAFDAKDPQQTLDPHPTDLLRLHLAIGVIDALSGLAQDTRDKYISDIETVVAKFTNGDTIELVGNLPVSGTNTLQPLNVQVPLAYMQQSARAVGAYIANAQAQALKGHSIQDIETWDDHDEQIAVSIAQKLAAGKDVAGLGDDAQTLAAATMVLLQDASKYEMVTERLNGALDQSFASDPIWGVPPADKAWIRYSPKPKLK